MTDWVIFCPFIYPPKKKKKSEFWKNEKIAGDIIILHKWPINHNHIRYGSWDMEWDRQNFLPFWAIFCPFTLLITQKMKILKKWKKCLEMSSFHTSVPKIMIICYTVPEMCPPPKQPKKSKFFKIKKMPGDIIILHMCTKNYNQMMMVPEIWCTRDGLTDRQKKWHASRCPT